MTKSPNRVLVAIIGVVVIAVALVAVLSASKSTVVIDRSTPAGTVQAYLKAVFDGKNVEAAKIFSHDSVCTVADLDRVYIVSASRVNLIGSSSEGNTAEVRVRLEIPSGSPFGDFTTEEHTFRLVNSHGDWLLAGIPWPLYDCGVVTK